MGGLLCDSVRISAFGFIILALVFAVVETVIALRAKKQALHEAQRDRQQISVDTLFDALAKVLAALKDLPAWVAIFLAGLALVWTTTSAPGLCT